MECKFGTSWVCQSQHCVQPSSESVLEPSALSETLSSGHGALYAPPLALSPEPLSLTPTTSAVWTLYTLHTNKEVFYIHNYMNNKHAVYAECKH